jgi:type IV secretory pathway VirB4 component
MRYKQPIQQKLDQLENMLIGLQSQFSNPAFTIVIAKDMISELKDKVEEVRTLVNAEQE